MELSLSIGGGDLSRRRGICGGAGDQLQTRQHCGGGDEEKKEGWPLKNGAPLQLDLKLSWSTDAGTGEDAAKSTPCSEKCSHGLGLDVNEMPLPSASFRNSEVGYSSSSSDSRAREVGKRGDCEMDAERGGSRYSDEEEGGGSTTSARKKLRLSKEQSGYLEESFKEHPTLNPKQKMALAKKLNLQPRQVEVWFQNRRARTKLKQTEVDCEYLKRCCESLTEENRRLQRELQDLRALKSPHNLIHLHGPATTLTMCPSCKQLTTTTTTSANSFISSNTGSFDVGMPKSRFFPFAQRTSAAS